MYLNGNVAGLWRLAEPDLHRLGVALDVLVNKGAYIFISVNIQLGCVFNPQNSVSMWGTPCLELYSDGIVNKLTKGVSTALHEYLKEGVETIPEMPGCSHWILSQPFARLQMTLFARLHL